ncbi:MAG: tandem-95 repeat protein, partial [Planctomycetes bacterium]|nr:tandem-95 repeat protein [Planctomycetota bacterium]
MSWTPPVGIPAPDFGISETYMMYADSQQYLYDYGSGPEPYHIGANGPYTHYIDNTDPNATDTDNPFGTPDRPRLTIPLNLPAGSVVEVHGDDYSYFLQTPSSEDNLGGARLSINGEGTADRPIFVHGVDGDEPTFGGTTKPVWIEGAYIVVEDIDFTRPIEIRPRTDFSEHNHHISIRDCQVHDFDATGINLGWPHGLSSHSEYRDPTLVNDVVIYDNDIYNLGDWLQEGSSRDYTGIFPHLNTYRTFILDNEVYYIDGDAIAVNPWGIYDDPDIQQPPRYVYIGRNKLHECQENTLDIKVAYDVVVSQNEMYGIHLHTTTSDGTAVVVHDDHGTDTFPYPERLWFLGNEVYDSDIAFRVQSSDDVHLVGNVIHDIVSSYDLRDGGYSPGGAVQTWRARNLDMSFNTIWHTDLGILAPHYDPEAALTIRNNIIADLTDNYQQTFGMPPYMLLVTSPYVAARSSVENNIFWMDGEAYRIQWGSTYDGLASFQQATGQGAGCLEVDPDLLAPRSGIFQLSGGDPASPAIDAAAATDFAAEFFQLYGLNIDVDFNGRPRTSGAAPDIGAFEFVGGDNTPPVADDATVVGDEDQAVTGSLSGSDADGDELTFAAVNGPAHGTLQFQADGSFTYTPQADWNGTDTFTFITFDGTDISAAATVTVTVRPVNDAPVADDLVIAALPAQPVAAALSATDIDDDELTYALAAGPAHGSVQLDADGAFTYTPAAGFAGTDSFTFVADDGSVNSPPATVTVYVGQPHLAVGAAELDFGLDETELTFTVSNDGGGMLRYSVSCPQSWLTISPAEGSATGESDTITVRASRDWLKTGTHTASITVDGGAGGSAQVAVSVEVPRFMDVSLVEAGQQWTYLKGLAAPAAGWNDLGFDDSAWLDGDSPIGYGDLDYATTLSDMRGNYAAFFSRRTFQVGDPSSVTSLTLGARYDDGFVAYINGVEVARSESMGGSPGTAPAYDALAAANHSEEAAEELFPLDVPSGLLQAGENVLAIEVHNVSLNSSDAGIVPRLTASLDNSPNHAPAAGDLAVQTDEDTALHATAPASDADGDELTFTVLAGPAHGSLDLQDDGQFTYIPEANWYGTDGFTFSAADGRGKSDSGSVTITVNSVNDAPVAGDDGLATAEDTPATTLNVLANDRDVDHDALSVAGFTQPAHGTVAYNGDGLFTYSPDADFNGTDSFTYTVSDTSGATDTGTVTVTVQPVNDAPDAADDQTVFLKGR